MASFAPYTPPPDDPSRLLAKSRLSRSHPGIWFPDSGPSRPHETSYQSGGHPSSRIPVDAMTTDVEQGRHDEWDTTYGVRVDVLAAFAYLLGPVSAFILLVLETRNDYVRFHAYQAALSITPLFLLCFIAELLRFPSLVSSLFKILLCATALSMAIQAFSGAYRGGLSRYHLPKIGSLAEQWVAEE